MNRITTTFLASCIAMGAASAMAQAGGGGGPGLNSPDSGAAQQKPLTGGTGPTNPNAMRTAPTATPGDAASGGNLSGNAKASGGAMSSGQTSRSTSKKGAAGNTQGSGQAQTPSAQ
ncbi:MULTISPECIES: hypothetical protein [unclassified Variovorax]|uniref:hypothetical protein n=1 Tax=unclassified Variovorax TaxID=663243 RepID=UPI003F466F80